MTHKQASNTMNYENYDLSFPDQPVVDLYLPVWSNLPAFRSKPAFIWVDDDGGDDLTPASSLTYSQLNDAVQSISSRLLLSLRRGQTVVVLSSPGLALVPIIFACQRAGLLTVPIFPPAITNGHNNLHHLRRVLSHTNPHAAIAHPDYARHLNRLASDQDPTVAKMLADLVWISTDEIKRPATRGGINSIDSSSYRGCGPDDDYLIQYTSGATGIPKPVVVTAGSAAHNVRTARRCYDLGPNSVIASWLPQYHDCGLMFLLLTVVSGATCVLTSPAAFVKRPRLWLELVSEFKATCTPVPSFALPLVVRRGGVGSEIDLNSLRNLIIINEPIYRAPVEEFVAAFVDFGLRPSSVSPSYGLAENCTFVSTAWRANHGPNYPDIPSHNRLLPSARLASSDEDQEIIVVNEHTGEPAEDGVEGEIWVSSPSNASGYLHHPFLTSSVFGGRLRSRVSPCFVRTGDRGIVKGEERYLFVMGRCADVITLHNGREIHPHYIETAAQLSCRDFLRGGCLAAFEASGAIVLVAEMQRSDSDARRMRGACERMRRCVMEEEGVAVGLVVLVRSGGVPKTTSGKVQRWAAKEKVVGGRMRVAMEMEFGGNYGFMPLTRNRIDENRVVVVDTFVVPNRSSMLSLL